MLYFSVAFLFLLFLVVLVWVFIVLFKGFCLLILFKFFYCF
ncbi:putative membrane protein [Helicobacter pylori R037c]|nr:putative membrane protein [Helicobacter pylori R037c]